jgi:hypothetical protein
VEWASRSKNWGKAESSLKSFLFSLRDPHNFPARGFALKPDKKNEAIAWSGAVGIGIACNCSTNTASYTLTASAAFPGWIRKLS